MASNADALRQAGQTLKKALGDASPTTKSRRSWHMRTRSYYVTLQSQDVGTIMTDRNAKHPLWAKYGSKRYTEGRRVPTNDKHPERTHFIGKTTDAVTDKVANEYADLRVNSLVRQYFGG
jgi:hypothetical protein